MAKNGQPDYSIEQLEKMLKTKKEQQLAPSIAKYYDLQNQMKAAHKAILAIQKDWKPASLNTMVAEIVQNAGIPLSKAEIEKEHGEGRNLGLCLTQLVKNGTLIKTAGATKQLDTYALAKPQ
jgi:hypothetical protein